MLCGARLGYMWLVSHLKDLQRRPSDDGATGSSPPSSSSSASTLFTKAESCGRGRREPHARQRELQPPLLRPARLAMTRALAARAVGAQTRPSGQFVSVDFAILEAKLRARTCRPRALHGARTKHDLHRAAAARRVHRRDWRRRTDGDVGAVAPVARVQSVPIRRLRRLSTANTTTSSATFSATLPNRRSYSSPTRIRTDTTTAPRVSPCSRIRWRVTRRRPRRSRQRRSQAT